MCGRGGDGRQGKFASGEGKYLGYMARSCFICFRCLFWVKIAMYQHLDYFPAILSFIFAARTLLEY